MPKFISFNSPSPEDLKENPLKKLWESFQLMPMSIKSLLVSILLFIVVTPFIVNNRQIFNPHAQETQQLFDVNQIDTLTSELLNASLDYQQSVAQQESIILSTPSATLPFTPTPSTPLPTKTSQPTNIPVTESAQPQESSPSTVKAGSTSRDIEDKKNKMIDIAKKRSEILKQIIRTNPQEFLNKATLVDKRDSLPEPIKKYIEQKISVQGELTIFHGDDFKNKKSYKIFNLKSDQKSARNNYVLYFIKEPEDINSGTSVSINGVTIDQEIAVTNLDSSVKGAQTSTAVLQATTTNITTAVILVKFQNTPNEPYTSADANSLMFTNSDSIKKYYEENSFGKITLSGDVYGWYSIPYNTTDPGVCTNYLNLVDAANNQASANGVNLSNYSKRLYLFPNIRLCSYTGIATIGGQVAISYYNVPELIAHELGHILGANHASFKACPPKSIDIPSRCTDLEYGDYFDVMGGSSYLVHFNGPHKYERGWLNNVLSVITNGTYTVGALETAGSSPQLITIRKSDTSGTTSDYYFISYRQKTGFDSNLCCFTDNFIAQGASIHVFRAGQFGEKTYFLDTTPSVSLNTTDFFNTTLTDGATFFDEINNISIKQISHTLSTDTTPGSATITVTFVTPTPTPSPTPLSTPIPSPTPPSLGYQRVFVTSTTYNGDLKTAGSELGLGTTASGLDGADKICQSRANATNLGGTFKAWISDRNTSVPSRLTHYTTPYKLLNSTTIANNWIDLTDGNLLVPINITELNTIQTTMLVWTNTYGNGSSRGVGDCNLWNYDKSLIGAVGTIAFADNRWTNNFDLAINPYCDTKNTLYCFEEPPLPTLTPTPTPAPTKRVFVSKYRVNGNIKGLKGANTWCENQANQASLGGIWKAWLSSSATSASTNITTHNNGPYKLVNGTTVANSWADLTDGTLLSKINRDQFGTLADGIVTWTNTTANGLINSKINNCSNWTSVSGTSNSGHTGFTNTQWTKFQYDKCSTYRPLYCFEQ